MATPKEQHDARPHARNTGAPLHAADAIRPTPAHEDPTPHRRPAARDAHVDAARRVDERIGRPSEHDLYGEA